MTSNITFEKNRRDDRVHVAHLATRLIVAGMGNVIASLIREMPADRYQSAVWCLEEADILGQQLRTEGYEIIELKRRWRRDFALLIRIARLLRKNQVDILHCHDELSWFYGAIAGWLAGKRRVLVTMHGRRTDISSRHLYEQKILARITTAIIAVSSYLNQQCIKEIKISPKKMITIYNGILIPSRQPEQEQRYRARKILGLPEEVIVVGSVGRLAEVKNFALLIDAAANARAAIPSLRVVLIGEGPCYAHLIRKVAELGLSEIVTFTGLRQDVAELLPALDLYVCSSNYEGVSLSILEAMMAGLAVIATAVGGNTEIIRHNETGILIEKGNQLALTNAIVDLAHDENYRHRLGEQARRAGEANYCIDRMIRNYDSLYMEVQGTSQDKKNKVSTVESRRGI